MHRPQLCEPGSLVCDGAVTGRFVELKDAGLEGDLVTYNTLLKACMRSANLPCARVIMTWIRERGPAGDMAAMCPRESSHPYAHQAQHS